MEKADAKPYILKNEVEPFLAWLDNEWRTSNKHFKRVQTVLLEAVESDQVPCSMTQTLRGSKSYCAMVSPNQRPRRSPQATPVHS